MFHISHIRQRSSGTPHSALRTPHSERAFTMVEIAISLAIIGFALVAIIGVLPIGMTVQKDNREETIVNQDATVFMNAIRNGALGLDYLTNYVTSIYRRSRGTLPAAQNQIPAIRTGSPTQIRPSVRSSA